MSSPEKLLSPYLLKLSKEAAGRYGNPAVKKDADEAILALPTLQRSADAIFPVLQRACASKVPKYMVLALDCIEKLLAHGLLARHNKNTFPNQATIIVKTISQCASQQDDAVQLQVVKALLTCVITGIAHESNLLLALRACYHIHLVSDNAVNRTTAKISLTQMINYLFENVHTYKDKSDHEEEEEEATAATTSPAEIAEEEEEQEVEAMYPEVLQFLGFDRPATKQVLNLTPEEEDVLPVVPLPTSNTETVPTASTTPQPTPQQQLEFPSIGHKDAFLVLRTLSKLSMKELTFEDLGLEGNLPPAGTTEEDFLVNPRVVKSKILSLELLSHALQTKDNLLKQSDALLFALKQYLFPALMKNCMEVNLGIATWAVKVFEQILQEFKTAKLKKEIELLISNVYLAGLLDSPLASFESRQLVCQSLLVLCSDVRLLVEIFFNYDCDWNSKNLLKTIAQSLSRVAVSNANVPTSTASASVAEYSKLAKSAVTCLGALAKSLSSYSSPPTKTEDVDDIDEVSNTANNNGEEDDLAKLASSQALSSFQQKQVFERDMKAGIALFNQLSNKPSKALTFWREKRLLVDDLPETCATFLLAHSNVLSKTQIGEVLGGDSEESKEILRAYCNLFDFSGQPIDAAIRTFLSHFRLPGEAQKVDRVFENFASRYWEMNKTEFPNADCAFVLSFAIIMLQTDAHNPNIKPERKMKKADFLKNNRGIASGRDLSAEFLGGIYDRIQAKAITMKGEDLDYKKDSVPNLELMDEKGKRREFYKQRREILNSTASATSSSNAAATSNLKFNNEELYFQVEQSKAGEHIGPMFTLVFTDLKDAFVANFLITDDPLFASTCLEGLYNSIRVSARFHLEMEREDLIQILLNLTKLLKPNEIQPKNVMCIQALVTLAVSEPNYLGTSWNLVLQCISELARLLAMNAQGQDDSLEGLKEPVKAVVQLKRVLDFTAVDRIFVGSEKLDETAIVDFVRALVLQSRSELGLDANGSPHLRTRLFSLQKMVEVADFNLATRGRVTWGKIWEILSPHFVSAAVCTNPNVSLYAVDSLKQLSLKFLNRDEFVGFMFQDAFLRPFEQICKESTLSEVRFLVLTCMQLFVTSKAKNIKSGWGAVLDVVSSSSEFDNQNSRFGFTVLELCHTVAPKMLFAHCALKFATTKQVELAIKSLHFLDPLPVLDTPAETHELLLRLEAFALQEDRKEVQVVALSCVISAFKQEKDDANQSLALVTEFFDQFQHVDTSYASLPFAMLEMSKYLAMVLYERKLPDVDVDVFLSSRGGDSKSKSASALPKKPAPVQTKRERVFLPVLGVFLRFTSRTLVASSKASFVDCGVATWNYLFLSLGDVFSIEAWDLFLSSTLADGLPATSPAKLNTPELLREFGLVSDGRPPVSVVTEANAGKRSLTEEELASGIIANVAEEDGVPSTPLPPAVSSLDVPLSLVRALGHFGLIKLLCQMVEGASLQDRGFHAKLCDLLETSLKEASAFNEQHALRMELQSRGGSSDAMEVEVLAATTLLRAVQRNKDEVRFSRVWTILIGRYLRQDRVLAAEQTLFVRTNSGNNNGAAATKKSDSEKELFALTPVVLLALREMLELADQATVDRTLKWSFAKLLELVECPNRDIRAVVRKIFEKHVAPRLHLQV